MASQQDVRLGRSEVVEDGMEDVAETVLERGELFVPIY